MNLVQFKPPTPLVKFGQLLWYVARRAVVFYLIIFFLSSTFINYQKLKFDSQLRLLNQVMPTTFVYLVEMIEKQGKTGKNEILIYRNFYEETVKNFPEAIEAYPMLGFCYYYDGKRDRAIVTYKKAIRLAPKFFWSYYNLGVIYFKNGDYKQAIDYLKKSVDIKAQDTLNFIVTSKAIFSLIIADDHISYNQLLVRLATGYQNAYRLLILSFERTKNYDEMLKTALDALKMNVGGEDAFYFYAGLSSYEKKDYQNAMNYLQGCLQRDPNHPDAYYYYGLILGKLGKEDDSKRVLNRASLLRDLRDAQPLFNELQFPVPQLNGEGINLRIF